MRRAVAGAGGRRGSDEAGGIAQCAAEDSPASGSRSTVEAADAAAAVREERRQEKLAREAAERKIRGPIIRQMQGSITKDAKERVTDGYLEGPIMYTSFYPLGGGSVDDLTALTTTFDCIAVNEELGGGRVSGYGFERPSTGTRPAGPGNSTLEPPPRCLAVPKKHASPQGRGRSRRKDSELTANGTVTARQVRRLVAHA